MPRVFVTGAGIITAIGSGLNESFESLTSLRSGIGALTLFNSIHSDIPVAEVSMTNEQLAEKAGTDIKQNLHSRNSLLALIAAGQALRDHQGLDLSDHHTALVLATTVGGMDLNELYYDSLLKGPEYSRYIDLFDSGDCAEKVAARYGICHNITTVSTACSSSANAIMYATRQIRAGKLTRALAGGTDSLTKFTINGFRALEILSLDGCKPFDKNRNGLTIGEGAAILLLESEDTAAPSEILCEVTGYANANEAYHQTASSPEGTGAYMAMCRALETAGLSPADVDYINAHGTGTEVNDLAEATAIMKLFGDKVPPVSSTKAFTGHTLGAAGAVEAVFSIIALQKQLHFLR
jgi:3-oxoacyl-[acyl-carrier-protein] synthase-1